MGIRPRITRLRKAREGSSRDVAQKRGCRQLLNGMRIGHCRKRSFNCLSSRTGQAEVRARSLEWKRSHSDELLPNPRPLQHARRAPGGIATMEIPPRLAAPLTRESPSCLRPSCDATGKEQHN